MKKQNWKSILLTLFLVVIIAVVFYSIIGMNVSGPYYKNRDNNDKIVEKIKSKHKDEVKISRNSFKYITFTCETKNKYVIYDENAKKLLERDKDELRLDDVNAIINEKYPYLAEENISISYAYKNIAYQIKNDDNSLLLLDFDTLKKVFYMKEGL